MAAEHLVTARGTLGRGRLDGHAFAGQQLLDEEFDQRHELARSLMADTDALVARWLYASGE